ncbi:hypothetical protein L484_000841 [Morus notabilis]|uniref:Uncharacterized protein n=1 Tax=Morus notabilis TaxID=981085 RepID=W9SQ18_9ROSA|nr:hypothetical protein L484_000841 [Morus notabilis]
MVKFVYLKSPLPEKEIVVAAATCGSATATCRTMAEVTSKAMADVQRGALSNEEQAQAKMDPLKINEPSPLFDSTQVYEPNK